MFKIVYLLILLALGISTSFFFTNLGVIYQILIAIALFLGYFLVSVIIFFIVLFFEVIWENKNKKREYQSKYYRRILHFYNKFLFALFSMKIHYSGIEKIDLNKQYVIVANHRSNLDSLLIDNYLYKMPLVFIGKESLFKIPFVGKLIHGCAYIKLNRKNLKEQFYAIEDAIKFISRSDNPLSIGIFPEGTRGSDPNYTMGEFKAGSFHIVKKSKKPIIVSAIRGTKEVNKHLLFKKHDVYYDIIRVIQYEEYKDMNCEEIAIFTRNIIEEYLKEKLK